CIRGGGRGLRHVLDCTGAWGAPDGPARSVPLAHRVDRQRHRLRLIVGYYRLPFVMSLYLQQVRGLSPLATGAVFLPMMLIGAALTPFSARAAERVGARTLITAGLVLMGLGLAVLAFLPASAPVWVLSSGM